MKENKENNNTVIGDDEVNLIQLAKCIWKNRLVAFRIVFVAGLLGLLVAVFSPVEYQSETVFIPLEKDSNRGVGGLSSLAAMAGVNIGSVSSSQVVPTLLYSEVVSSVPFQKDLMSCYITNGRDSISIYNYRNQSKTDNVIVSTFSSIISFLSNKIPFLNNDKLPNQISGLRIENFTKKEYEVSNWLQNKISLNVDDETNAITIRANMPSGLIASEVCDSFLNLLQEYITQFRIKKASEHLVFIQKRYTEQRKLIECKELELASYKDSNKNLSTAASQINLMRLNNEYNVLFGVYSELAKQLEQSKFQVKEDTPVFMVLSPVSIPVYKNKPKRVIICVIFVLIGFIISLGYILFRELFVDLKREWEEV